MRHQGRLVFDSDQAGASAGARGGIAAERALLFRAHDLAVDLVVEEGGEALHVLRGQVVDEASGAPVVAARVRLGDDRESVPTDERGQFAVSTLVGGGEQFLWIDTPERQVLCSIPARTEES
jgi:hypothetical protein